MHPTRLDILPKSEVILFVISSIRRTDISRSSAIPFALSEEEAIVHLGPHVSMSTAGKGIVGSLGAKFLPGFGFRPIQPTHIQAVYLPSWVVSALFTVDVQPKTMEKVCGFAQSVNCRMNLHPGNNYRLFRRLAYAR